MPANRAQLWNFATPWNNRCPKGHLHSLNLSTYGSNQSSIPQNTVEMTSNSKHIHWATYNYKLVRRRCTRGYIPHNAYEREMFQKVADKNCSRILSCLEHIGSQLCCHAGYISCASGVGCTKSNRCAGRNTTGRGVY